MTDRVREAFENARKEGRIALVPFLTVGHPTVESSIASARAVVEAGADALELGVPFSDSLADGPVIQMSNFKALEQGVTVATCLDAARQLRAEGMTVPIILMGSYNPILSYGLAEFCIDAAAAGVDGLIVSDLPTEETGPLLAKAKPAGLSLVPLLALTSSEERIQSACREASGFIYCVAALGVTGARESVSDRVRGLVADVKRKVSLPAAVGFGISTAEHVAEVATFADGAVVGSALVQTLDDGPPETAPQRARDFIEGLAAGTRLPGAGIGGN